MTNVIIVTGYLGKDAEFKYLDHGTAVCTFNLAHTHKNRNRKGETTDVTTWFRVTIWGKQAEGVHEYLTKGKPITVRGRLEARPYKTKDGQERLSVEINDASIDFLPSGGGNAARENAGRDSGIDGEDSGLPF